MTVFLSVAVLALCVAAILLKMVYGKVDILEPIVPAVITMAGLFSIRPLAMIATGETVYYRWVNIEASLDPALSVCVIGVASYLFGYLVSAKAPRFDVYPYVEYRISKKRLVMVCFTYIGLSIMLTAAYLGRDPIGTLSVMALGRSADIGDVITVHTEYLFVAPLLLSCCATLLILGLTKEGLRVGWLAVLLVLIVVPVLYFYLVGARRFIIPVFAIPLVVYFLVRKIRPKLKTLLVGVAIFYIIAAIPFMRTGGAREQIGGLGRQLIYAFMREDIFRGIFLGPDTEMLAAFAVEFKVLKEPRDFYYGRAVFGDLLFAPIPSALFDKPRSARNDILMKAFGSVCDAGPGGLCPDFSVIGTFYQDLWVPGVVVGMAFCGWASRRIWLRYRAQPANPYAICSAAITFVFTLVIIRAGFMPAFQWALYFFVPITVGVHFARRKIRRVPFPSAISQSR
jgi:hypothetical protein